MSGPMREERKVVTALFADVVGSTELTERLDPEDAREVLGAAVRGMVEAVEAFGGTVKDLAGDGILALFGAPVTHEDDAERAIRAGLRIVDGSASPVAIRVGIDTGLVVLGPIGGGGRVEYGATGDALNTAARLQSHADPGTVMIGEATRRAAAGRFEWGDARRLEVKGKAEPVSAFEVLGEARTPRAPVASTPMVGREREFDRASRIASRALAGQGGALITVGEPGIGKSRLIEELRRHVGEAAWLEGRCVSYGASTPFLPLREIVQDALGASGDELDDAPSYLAAVLGTDADERMRSLSPETRRLRTLDAIRSVIVASAGRRPTVIALEDLHWADASTIQALERLLPACQGLPLLFVFSTRPGDASGTWLPEGAEVIELSPLPSDRVDELVRALMQGGSLPVELLARVVETSGGNPLFLSELVRSLAASGSLDAGAGGAMPELPNTIEKVILARLDLLEPSAHDVITAASVLGRVVALPVLERLVGSDPRGDTDELVRARLFERDGQPDELWFAHALIQEVAYGSLLKRRRRELHSAAAVAIEDLWPDRIDENLGILAIHHRGAGDLRAALRCHDLAADRAERVHATEEALDHRTASIGISNELDMTVADKGQRLLARARLRARTGDAVGARSDLEALLGADVAPDLAMRAHDELGFVLAGAADYRAAIPHLEAALAVAEDLDDGEGEVSALSRLSIVHANRLDFDAALEYGERGERTALASGDERLQAKAMDALKQVALQTGDVDTLEELVPRLCEIHRRNDDLWLLQFAVLELGYADLERMRLDRAFDAFDEALAINRRIGDVGNEPLYLAMIGRAHRGRGDYEQAIGLGRRARDLALELGHGEWSAWTAGWLGSTLLEVGDLAGASVMLAAGAESAERAGADLHLVRYLGMGARAAQALGDTDRAVELADRATAILDRVRVRAPRANVMGQDAYVGVALVRLAQGRLDAAEGLVGPIVSACAACGWSDGIVDGSLVLAETAFGRGDISGSVDAATAAVTEARRTGLPTLWRAHRGAARALRAAGQADRAAGHDDEAARAFARLLDGIHDRSIRDALVSVASTDRPEEGVGRWR
jgi:class 3 adenylate cyclase/tetratricopeptide (TPR) repeat protein